MDGGRGATGNSVFADRVKKMMRAVWKITASDTKDIYICTGSESDFPRCDRCFTNISVHMATENQSNVLWREFLLYTNMCPYRVSIKTFSQLQELIMYIKIKKKVAINVCPGRLILPAILHFYVT